MNIRLLITLISLITLGLSYVLYKIFPIISRELWVYKNRDIRNPAANRLLWTIANS